MSYQPPDPLKPPTEEDITAWFISYFESGVNGLREDAQFAWAMVRVLIRQALELCLEGKGADGVLGESSPHVEAELLHKTPGMLRGGSPAEDSQDTQHLQELLTRYDELAEQAGWLRREAEGHRFSDPTFAALLVGDSISDGHERVAELRVQVLRGRSWAQAAWVAVLLGDDLGHYLTLLEREAEPLWLLEGLFVFAHALGGAPDGLQPTEALQRFFLMSMATLVWLAPVRKDYAMGDGRSSYEEDSPLYLALEDWRRAIACLARSSRLQGRDLPDLDEAWKDPSEPLRRILVGLGLPSRLSEEEARAVCVLCAPVAAAWQGWMRQPFWRTIHVSPSDPRARWWNYWANTPWHPNWARSALPALLSAQPAYARSVMLCPGEDNSLAWYLINDAELAPLWMDLWRQALTSPEASRAASAWAQALVRFPQAEMVRDFLLEVAPDLLRTHGQWAEAVQELDRKLDGFFWPLWSRSRRDAGFIKQVILLLQVSASRLVRQMESNSPPQIAGPDDLQQLLSIGIQPVAVMRRWLRALREAPDTWYAGAGQPQRSLLTLLNLGDPQVFSSLLGELAALTLEQAVKSGLARALHAFPPGPWLDPLLTWLREERSEQGRQLLTRLAQRSQHFEVRRRCLRELLS